jgi:hypothetical protein
MTSGAFLEYVMLSFRVKNKKVSLFCYFRISLAYCSAIKYSACIFPKSCHSRISFWCQEIGTSSIDWAQLSRLLPENLNRVQSPKRRFEIKSKTTDNIQKVDNCNVSQLSNGFERNQTQIINYNGRSLRYLKTLFQFRRLDSVKVDGNKIMND